MPHYHAYYETYAEEQFAADEYFQQWVLAEDRRNNHFWKSYVESYPEKFDIVLNARRLVKELAGNSYGLTPLSHQEKSDLKDAIYEQVELQDSEIAPRIHLQKKRWQYSLSAAAVLICMAAGAYLFFKAPAKKEIAFLVEQTGAKEIKEITLPDSSVVILNANSSLKFSSHFSDDSIRVVYLEGNGYFKVKRTSMLKPFIVQAHELKIRVTGTEFNVNARSKATDIVLTSGKVNVTLNDNGNTSYMKAGERLKLDTVNKELISSAANTELYTTAWKNKEWHFQETTLDSIAELIKEYYGMEMVFKNARQKKLMITAIVSVNDFSTLVNVIAKTLNIKIKEERNQLLIY